MKSLLLLALLLPAFIKAQEVSPILSKDYLALINNDSSSIAKTYLDTTNSVRNARLKMARAFNGYPVERIKIKGHTITLLPVLSKTLLISGNFSSSVEIKSANRQPALQNSFVQGRSMNGATTWQGPETDEVFSYGPAINTLQFDGSNYPYDMAGRLVVKGAATGKEAGAYNNSIIRRGHCLSQAFHLQSRYLVGGRQVLNAALRLGQTTEQLLIANNKNKAQNIHASAEASVGKLFLSGSYGNQTARFSNSNRNGFLNRVYQSALLTPVSFQNNQGTRLGALQRAYTSTADNPFFLLENNVNAWLQTQQTGSFAVEKKADPLKFKITQSVVKLRENSREGYEAGTAFFPNTTAVNRRKTIVDYLLQANASYDVKYNIDYFNSKATANYLFSNSSASIGYTPGVFYHYQRSANDVSLGYQTTYREADMEAAINLANKIYSSNTTAAADYFLPNISAYVRRDGLFGQDYLDAKLAITYHNTVNELPLGTSASQSNLLQLSTAQAGRFFPVLEVESFDGLLPIETKEWSTKFEVFYRHRFSFGAELFRRTTFNDVFPVYDNGVLRLTNLAHHRNLGVELEAGFSTYQRNLQTSHALSFFTNRSKVLTVKEGFNFTPIAGFSNINKALVAGEVLGAIVGSRYSRDAAHNIIIGSDGFPVVDPTLAVIGNPLPDFVIKTTNAVGFKKLSLSIDCEWKKGGEAWNGTEAVLDYYGRSRASGLQRATNGYVFAGVLQSGHINTTPVSFYDASLPVEKNRWVRYGHSGVAEAYIQKTDYVRLNNLALSYRMASRKYFQSLLLTAYASNIIIWTAYKGADHDRLLFEGSGTSGLDFFNLPSQKTFGCSVSIQF